MPEAQRPERGRHPVGMLYDLLSDTSFAIAVIIALAVASILGVIIVDQIPFRGDMVHVPVAQAYFAERGTSNVQIWILETLVPERPFRCTLFRTLLALLSLSLLACTIKRWRGQWRRAFSHPDPAAGAWEGAAAVAWATTSPPDEGEMSSLLRRQRFRIRTRRAEGGFDLAATRGGLARLGPGFTHLGFLFLVVGGLWMASAGSSHMLWLSPGQEIAIPETALRLEVVDFRIDLNDRGQIADYVSSVRLWRDSTEVRSMSIEVNKPLRHQGRSFYQASYRQDPTHPRSITMVFDTATDGRPERAPRMSGTDAMSRPLHAVMDEPFANPVSLQLSPGERLALPDTPYSAEIDTFFIDFRVEAGGPTLGSLEPRNPAVLLSFFAADTLAGQTWYFALHPDMPVGSGPDLPLRFSTYDPRYQTGLELATHPGSGWIWAGFAVMTLGTLLSFLLRHERVHVRCRRAGEAWELCLVHTGASTQEPARVTETWEAAITSLAARLLRRWAPVGGAPTRWPQGES